MIVCLKYRFPPSGNFFRSLQIYYSLLLTCLECQSMLQGLLVEKLRGSPKHFRQTTEEEGRSSCGTYKRKKQLIKLRTKAEKVAEEKLGSQLDIIARVKY